MQKRVGWRRALAALVAGALCLPGTAHLQAPTPGEIDPAFDPGNVEFGFGTAWVEAVLVQPDGKILIGGAFSTIQGVTRNGMARLNADGTLDTTFVPPFPVANKIPLAHIFVRQPDGKILVGGDGLNVGGIPYPLVRLNPDGSLDPTFTLQEMAVSRGIEAVVLLPDGRVMIGGDFSNIGAATMRTLARLNADGTLDPTFNLEATTTAHGGAVRCLVRQPDGSLLAGGEFQLIAGGVVYDRLARIRPDATVDPSLHSVFNVNEGPVIRSIALRPDGAFYVGGRFSSIDGLAVSGAARLSAAGAPDLSFDPHLGFSAVEALLLQTDGKLLVTGNIFIPGDRRGIARLLESGDFDDFYPRGGDGGLGPGGIGLALARQADGNVVVGGSFFLPGGVPRQRVARLLDVPLNHAPVAVDDLATTPEDVAVTVNVTANDTDADGDALIVTAVTNGAHGTATVSGPGSVVYTPAANYHGPDAVTCTVSDGHGGTDTGVLTLAVTSVNDPPVAQPQVVTTLEDVALGIVLTGTDADGDPLAYSVVTAPAHGTLSGAPPNLLYTPAANYAGADAFTFTVNDGTVVSAAATISITVDPVNDPPVAVNDAYATAADTPLTVAAPGVLGNDTDVEGGPLIALLVAPPASGTVALNASGAFTYTPAAGFTGVDTFTYRANDGAANSAPATVSIAVAPPLMLVAGTLTPLPGGTGLFTGFPQGAGVSGSLAAFRATGASGQEGLFLCDRFQPGDPCTPIVSRSTPIPGGTGTFTGFGPPSLAGRFTSFIGTGTGQAGVYSCDRFGPGDPCLPLANRGTPIPAGTGTFSAFQRTDATGTLTAFVATGTGQAGVYVCDRFTPGDPCRPVANLGTAIPGGTGTFTGFGDLGMAADLARPDPPPIVAFVGSGVGQLGVYTCDRAIPTDPCRPVADLDTLIPGGTGRFTGFSRLAVGTRAAGAAAAPFVAFIASGAGQQGVYACDRFQPTDPCTPVATLSTAVPGGAGTFTGFTAVSTSRGHTAFLGQGGAGQAGIYVASTPQKVVAVGDTLAGRTVAALRLDARGLDGNRLVFAATFTDGFEGVFEATLGVVGNAAPFAIDDTAATSEDQAISIAVAANDVDLDGDPLTVTAVSAPAHGTTAITAPGIVTYTPAPNFNGSDAFTYAVSDGRGGSDTAAVRVTIAPVNDAPVAAGDSYSTPQDNTLTVPAPGVLANDSDADGDPLAAVLVSGAAHGTVALAASGSFTYVPASGYSGPDAFTYRASDGTATSNVATVGLTVTPAAPATWHPTGSLAVARAGHTATLLRDGRVLVAGGARVGSLATAEIYDPAQGTWTRTGNLNRPRVDHTATLLADGRVLVTGGSVFGGAAASSSSAEIYDPATGRWTLTGNLRAPHAWHTATLLPNGKVLLAGGAFAHVSGGPRAQASPAELYDPAAGTWSFAASLSPGRIGHQATLLADGTVLVSGGTTVSFVPTVLDRADVYDPATNTWSPRGDLAVARFAHTATLLADGRVLAAGGAGAATSATTAERYDPATRTWLPASAMAGRTLHTAVRLAGGGVLVAAGVHDGVLTRTADVFDPVAGTWSAASSLATARILHTMTRLADGRVLVVGGTSGTALLKGCEVYGP